MSLYTILNPDGFNGVALGDDVDLSPEDANTWIQEGARLQSKECDGDPPAGGFRLTSNDGSLL